MRPSAGTLLLGVFAVLFGLLGVYVVRKELHKPTAKAEAAKAAKPQTFVVPMASSDLEAGRKVTLGDIVLQKLTAAQMKAQHIDNNYMPSPKQIIGRVLREGLKEGSTFDTPDFYPEGTGPSVTPKLKPGYRAVTVTVENDAAVAGFAFPGAIVDVVFRANAGGPQEDNAPETTIVLIEAAEVLAVNQETATGSRPDKTDPGGPTKKAAVTLAVTLRQAADLRVVDGRGTMSIALRNSDDLELEPERLAPRTLSELLDRPTQKHKMEIYRGGRLSRVEFQRNKSRSAVQDLIAAETSPDRAATAISNPEPFGAAK